MRYVLKNNGQIFDTKRDTALSIDEIAGELNHLHSGNQSYKENNETLRQTLNHRTLALQGMLSNAVKLANLK